MKLCNCSSRPLGILDSRVVVENDVPYQVLYFGCTNKGCSEYKKKVWLKKINLFDNSDTTESDM
ncbi:MAG: hypothetical protein IJW74_00445 [Oscillospiraceae bacterium]|nr:hypothetical protein [Oscillospiraceae bacterium]